MSSIRVAFGLAEFLSRSTVLLCLCGGVLACSQHVQLRTAGGPAEVWIAGERVGTSTSGRLETEIPPGMEDVPFEIRRKSEVVRGVIPRTEPSIPWVATTIAATACCIPSLAATGFCLANPAMWLAVVGGCASVNPSLCLSVASFSPTWWSLPVAVSGAFCGATPLWANLWASRVPEVVDLTQLSREAARPEAPPAHLSEDGEHSPVSSRPQPSTTDRGASSVAMNAEIEPVPW